jgi:tetratricopeptide (TPR) repeat protein
MEKTELLHPLFSGCLFDQNLLLKFRHGKGIVYVNVQTSGNMLYKEIVLVVFILIRIVSFSQDSAALYFDMYVKTINDNPCRGLNYLDKANSIHPTAHYYHEREMTNLLLGNYLERIQDLKHAVSLTSKVAKNDSLSRLYYDLAGAEIPINLQKSIRFYKKAERTLIKAKLKYVFDPLAPKWVSVQKLGKEDRDNDRHWYDGDIQRIKDSICVYKKAVRSRSSDTMNSSYCVFMGNANFHLRHFKTALRNYDLAVMLSPKTPSVYNSRGLYKLFRRDKAGARSDFEISCLLSGTKIPSWFYPDCNK